MKKAFLLIILAICLIAPLFGQDRIARRPLYPAASSFAPSDISGLKVWYKSDSMVADGDATSNGDAVAKWTDKSGNSNPLYDQNTSTKRPTYQTNQINSLPAVSFDGTSDELRTGTLAGGGASVSWGSQVFTLYAVQQDNSGNPTAGVGWNWVTADDGGGFTYFQLQRYTNTSTTRWRAYDTSGNGTQVTTTISNGTASSDWHILSAIARSGNVQLYVDGVATTSVSRTGTNQNKSCPLWVGGLFGGSFTTLKLAELYVYNTANSDTDRHSNESYLSTKYGISVSVQ